MHVSPCGLVLACVFGFLLPFFRDCVFFCAVEVLGAHPVCAALSCMCIRMQMSKTLR